MSPAEKIACDVYLRRPSSLRDGFESTLAKVNSGELHPVVLTLGTATTIRNLALEIQREIDRTLLQHIKGN